MSAKRLFLFSSPRLPVKRGLSLFRFYFKNLKKNCQLEVQVILSCITLNLVSASSGYNKQAF